MLWRYIPPHVPLSRISQLVAGPSKRLAEERGTRKRIGVNRCIRQHVVVYPVLAGIQAGHKTRAGRAAMRRRTESRVERDRPGGELIDVWRDAGMVGEHRPSE